MTAKVVILIALALMGCSEQDLVGPHCGKPGELWTAVEESHADEHLDPVAHLIEISHANQMTVNGWTKANPQLASFLSKETQPSSVPIIYFDFDAHSNCKVVRDAREIIEKSGICRNKNCITGNSAEVPPSVVNEGADGAI